jgi:BolA protein
LDHRHAGGKPVAGTCYNQNIYNSLFLEKMSMTIKSVIETKLTDALQPRYLDVINESGNHNVPPGSESHFKAVVVSDVFADKPLVARHQLVYSLLDDEVRNHIHALALHTYTESEWQQRNNAAPESPACRGGSKHAS